MAGDQTTHLTLDELKEKIDEIYKDKIKNHKNSQTSYAISGAIGAISIPAISLAIAPLNTLILSSGALSQAAALSMASLSMFALPVIPALAFGIYAYQQNKKHQNKKEEIEKLCNDSKLTENEKKDLKDHLDEKKKQIGEDNTITSKTARYALTSALVLGATLLAIGSVGIAAAFPGGAFVASIAVTACLASSAYLISTDLRNRQEKRDINNFKHKIDNPTKTQEAEQSISQSQGKGKDPELGEGHTDNRDKSRNRKPLKNHQPPSPSGTPTGPAGEIAGTAGEITGPAGEVAGPAGEIARPAGEITGPAGEIAGTATDPIQTAGGQEARVETRTPLQSRTPAGAGTGVVTASQAQETVAMQQKRTPQRSKSRQTSHLAEDGHNRLQTREQPPRPRKQDSQKETEAQKQSHQDRQKEKKQASGSETSQITR